MSRSPPIPPFLPWAGLVNLLAGILIRLDLPDKGAKMTAVGERSAGGEEDWKQKRTEGR